MDEKNAENAISLSKLSERLIELDQHRNRREKWLELFKGIFAGNIFDWGALVVAQILENNESFGLDDAMKQIQPRPWLIDGFDAWLNRVEVTKLKFIHQFHIEFNLIYLVISIVKVRWNSLIIFSLFLCFQLAGPITQLRCNLC